MAFARTWTGLDWGLTKKRKLTRLRLCTKTTSEDLRNVWTERYKKAHKLFYGQKERSTKPRLSTKKVDWGPVALSVLEIQSGKDSNTVLEKQPEEKGEEEQQQEEEQEEQQEQEQKEEQGEEEREEE
ncbi:hypothetical protein INT45_009828 [Circinella minor]|uniref:Uncharacterized protein n=1 Tax=Circinella minor TaxID=1195481 RepID=A0A8H7S444_9FUNG|nr:hypothetical protein INT45_009828 [Circinella minor]